MRKRIVVSMLVIALAAALLGGAALAWFTDREEVNANFTAGTLDLADLQASLVTIENMAPGDVTAPETLTIANSGSLEMFYRISFVKDVASGTLGDVLHVYFDGVDQGTLASLEGEGAFIFDSTMRLAAGVSKDLLIHFQLPGTTGNAYQNQTYTGKLVVQAVQVKNNEAGGLPVTWGE